MRLETEIREAHGYMMDAHASAMRDGDQVEVEKIAMACHALIWALGHGEIFASVIEAARKAKDDVELEVGVLE